MAEVTTDRFRVGFRASATMPDGAIKPVIFDAAVLADSTGAIFGSVGNPLNVSIAAGGGGAVTIADGADVAEGATSATAYSDSTGGAAGTLVGLQKGLYVALKATGANAQRFQGTAADGAVPGGNSLNIGGIDQATGNLQSFRMRQGGANLADTLWAATVDNRNYVYTGSTSVQVRTVAGANNTAGTGVQAVGNSLWSTSDMTQASISFSASGDNTIVSNVASQTTRVHRIYLVVAGATSIKFKNGAGVDFTGAMPLAANGAICLDFSDRPYFVTAANTGFVINSSAAVQVSGWIDYIRAA